MAWIESVESIDEESFSGAVIFLTVIRTRNIINFIIPNYFW